jgi:hypothetical protein
VHVVKRPCGRSYPAGCRQIVVNRGNMNLFTLFCLRDLPAKVKKKGEPTSGLEPLTCSLRVIIRMFPDVAGGCETRITKPLSLLRVALSCRVLRSRWCQSGVNITLVPAQRCHPRLVLLGLNGGVSPQAIEPYPVPTTVPMLTRRKPDATADNC